MSSTSTQQTGGRSRARTLDDRPPQQQPAADAVLCVICNSSASSEDGVRFTKLPCGHHHCARCLGFAFNMAVRGRPFRPARCCPKTPSIDPGVLRAGVDATEVEQHMDAYLAHLDEHDCRDKLFCHAPTCSAFIPVAARSPRVGTCPKCGRKTCKRCRARSHWGACRAEALKALKGDEQLLDLAGRKNWKRCPDCGVMVERANGCPHMTCVCGCEFCYNCGRTPYESHQCAHGAVVVEVLDGDDEVVEEEVEEEEEEEEDDREEVEEEEEE